MIEHIFIFSSHESYPQQAVDLALLLANGYDKPICFLSCLDKKIKAEKEEIETVQQQWIDNLTDAPHPTQRRVLERKEDFTAFMEQAEASMVIFQLSEHTGYNKVQTLLKISRELRVPYLFVKPYFENINLHKVVVPVSFLVEEREKGVFCSSMGRFFGTELLMMPAKDYGSKAKNNSNAICALLDKFNLNYSFVPAQKDSFKVELEAVRRTQELQAGMVLISASRTYGLDDIIFGPKELHCINEATIPIMLINPRADLYVLCG